MTVSGLQTVVCTPEVKRLKACYFLGMGNTGV